MNYSEIINKEELSIDINLSSGYGYNNKQILEWATQALEIPLKDFEGVDTSNINFSLTAVKLIIQKMFPLAGIPVFSPIKVSDVKIGEKQTCKLTIQKIDHILGKHYLEITKSSIEVLNWISKNPLTTKNIEHFYSIYLPNIIDPIKSIYRTGDSTIDILHNAFLKKIPYTSLGQDTYQLGWGSKSRLIRGSATHNDKKIGIDFANNKFASALLLMSAGLPGTKNVSVKNLNDAINAASLFGYPVVVKPPIDTTRGDGVVMDVMNRDMLNDAFSYTQKFSKDKHVLIEKQEDGTVHRILIYKEKILAIYEKIGTYIEGNGEDNVENLINMKNNSTKLLPPWSREKIIKKDLPLYNALKTTGHKLKSVPTSGEKICIQRIGSSNVGGEQVDVGKKAHTENIELAIRVSKLFNIEHCGIDFITADITKPWHANNAKIIEVNHGPSLFASEVANLAISNFVSEMIENDGKIPIENANNIESAIIIQKENYLKDKRVYIVTKKEVLAPINKPYYIQKSDIKMRIKSLFLNKDVDHIIVVEDD